MVPSTAPGGDWDQARTKGHALEALDMRWTDGGEAERLREPGDNIDGLYSIWIFYGYSMHDIWMWLIYPLVIEQIAIEAMAWTNGKFSREICGDLNHSYVYVCQRVSMLMESWDMKWFT